MIFLLLLAISGKCSDIIQAGDDYGHYGITRKQNNNTYYLYQATYREKINKKDFGKIRGSGKSKVCTRSTYLGSAETILQCIKENRSPAKVNTRGFGLVAAAYQAAVLY